MLARIYGSAMSQIVLDAEAGQVSGELARRGVPPHPRVHVLVEVISEGDLPVAAIAQAGRVSTGWQRNLNSTLTPN
jgi:hypothetical protein